ncbi:hypothetical protein [Deinococcus hopiensis]|uniref:Uncharacterized protein n=1 Tax=Deinococcus hopiensis KR-140 TaxID=695939 RepID=A0A1W1UP91_9DEIO|nr:hypothetical protein [Deinococcus hopiensis]SMB82897.1 hypothetical protein SAMN00790413_04182 [Deinococcus hopiensis KR-140]
MTSIHSGEGTTGRAEQNPVGPWRLPVALALCTLPTSLAAPPPGLRGATLCVSPMLTVSVTAESGIAVKLTGLDAQIYAQVKTLLRAGGVKYREQEVCRSNADLNVSLRLRSIRGSPTVETQVSAYVEDEADWESTSWLGGQRRWSAVNYGEVNPAEAEVRSGLLKHTSTSLKQLVNDWKAANR